MSKTKLSTLDALREIDDGGMVEELGAKMREAANAAVDLGGKATVTLKLTFDKLGSRQVTVTPEINGTLPKRKSDPSVFFVDYENALSRDNPDQLRLPRTDPQEAKE